MVKQTNICFWENALDNCPESYRELFRAEKVYLQSHVAENSKVLEVGCGNGRSLRDVLSRTKTLYGVDSDVVAVKDARKFFSKISEASILLGDGRDLPYKNSFFDYVTCMNMAVNFGQDRHLFYQEMRRVLKDNGELIMSVFNEDAFEDRMKTYRGLNCDIKEIRGTTVIFDKSFGANISEQFSRSELEEIFEEEGLRPEEIVKAGVGYICRLGKD